MMEEILAQEEEHAEDMADLMTTLDPDMPGEVQRPPTASDGTDQFGKDRAPTTSLTFPDRAVA